MIFAAFDLSPLTACINCSFFYIYQQLIFNDPAIWVADDWHVTTTVVFGLVFSTMPRDWPGRKSQIRSSLCRVRRKTLAQSTSHTHTHTTILRPSWTLSRTTQVSRHQKGKTTKVKPMWIYWSNSQWVAVASAGPYANLHLDPDT